MSASSVACKENSRIFTCVCPPPPRSHTLDAYMADTVLTELLTPITRRDDFNKALEAQQNLVAGYEASAQLSTIEDLLYQHVPWTTVLRGAILSSITSGGIKPKVLEAFKRDFLQVSPLPG